mmetsp:Transcript_14296/g.16596  ORF Transcript_14296/g.16596 Transcript_14296/m.16596 type:complete len:95 (+) Transcript_14296:151-435(+)
MPLSKGLQPLSEGVPYNVESAFLASFLYYILTIRYGASNDDARATVATTLILLRMLPSKTRAELPHAFHRVFMSLLGLNQGAGRITGSNKLKTK